MMKGISALELFEQIEFLLKRYNKNFGQIESLYEKIAELINIGDYSGRKFIAIFEDYLLHLPTTKGSGYVPDDWADYTYRYALSLSFPGTSPGPFDSRLEPACRIVLELLRLFFEYEKTSPSKSWQTTYPIELLSEADIDGLDEKSEYLRFISVFNREYVYEMMRLNQELFGYNNLDHICGVHHLCMKIAHQLKNAGTPLDLGRISGAAIGHDFGKYGCRPQEVNRMPYLHYYYTDQWFSRHDIPFIGHIALNHSTWDLELENLPVESLVLVYADFRVKNRNSKDYTSEMHIYDLPESFNVIMSKLDNMDDVKEKRYRRVYAKLLDFENYLIFRNVDISPGELSEAKQNIPEQVHFALLHGKKIVDHLKHQSIDNNIRLMHQLRDETSLNTILEFARSENDRNNLRDYLRIFEEYSMYLSPKQKQIMLRFLYDQLTHPEDDIRRHAAQIIGGLIANYDEEYRKELPVDASLAGKEIGSVALFSSYLAEFIFPDHKIIPMHRQWIGHSLSTMLSSFFAHVRSNMLPRYVELLVACFNSSRCKTDEKEFILLNAIQEIPFLNEALMDAIADYAILLLRKQSVVIRLAALKICIRLLEECGDNAAVNQRLQAWLQQITLRSRVAAENYLRLKLAEKLNLDYETVLKFMHFAERDAEKVSDIYLSNLKAATEWILKEIQIDILLEAAINQPQVHGLYTAMHFCNLLKISDIENVRSRAGEALLKIMPLLPPAQKNDVAIELMRALEIDGYQFAEYIPSYLGRLLMFLEDEEMNEIISDIHGKIKQANPRIASHFLHTAGVAISEYPDYRDVDEETEGIIRRRQIKLLGILLNGLGNYNQQIRQVANSVLGPLIFGCLTLSLKQKGDIFRMIAKKVLILLHAQDQDVLLFLTTSVALNHIYRFISDFQFFEEELEIAVPQKIAFFPGTFDPFNLSHEQIATAIRDMGFEVYLQVDEFSWSKRTLANYIRRSTISMAVADELDIYLYPEQYSVNIANSHDLKELRSNFSGINVHFACGSDVLVLASAYKAQPEEDSIHSFPHILFERGAGSPGLDQNMLDEAVTRLQGQVIRLKMPRRFVDISSTQIRSYIDENRDISNLVDPLAQKFIYENGFYRREPSMKMVLKTISIDIETYEELTAEIISEIVSVFGSKSNRVRNRLREIAGKPFAGCLVIRDRTQNSRLIAWSVFHWVRSSAVFAETGNSLITEHIRSNSIGRILMIDGIYVGNSSLSIDIHQAIFTETFSYCMNNDFDYAVFQDSMNGYVADERIDLLIRHGFIRLPYGDPENPVFVVSMNMPSSLLLDVQTVIKEPFRSNTAVVRAINKSRGRLQKAIVDLYPGNLLFSAATNVMKEVMIRKICSENGVPPEELDLRTLGPAMCVPFGDILNRFIVPNTVTKSLHTEKLFAPDMKSFTIGAFPFYLSLEDQVRMLRSFDRPIILVDDLLHKGYRLKVIEPMLRKEGIRIQKTVLGILSGAGKEIMDAKGSEVDCVYFIPKLKTWFNENLQYPFIGGDTVWRGEYPKHNLLPSINLILPYTAPKFLKNAPDKGIYNLSKICFENSYEILRALEEEYQRMNGRNLTLGILGEVITAPRCLDQGFDIHFDLNKRASQFVANDIEFLQRLEDVLIKY